MKWGTMTRWGCRCFSSGCRTTWMRCRYGAPQSLLGHLQVYNMPHPHRSCHCHDFYKRLIEIIVRENGESCWQVDDASLDPNHGQGNATIFQVRRIVRSTFQVQQICWIHLSSATSFSHRDICMSEDPHIITIDHTWETIWACMACTITNIVKWTKHWLWGSHLSFYQAEICLCDRDLCNGADLVPEVDQTNSIVKKGRSPSEKFNCKNRRVINLVSCPTRFLRSG